MVAGVPDTQRDVLVAIHGSPNTAEPTPVRPREDAPGAVGLHSLKQCVGCPSDADVADFRGVDESVYNNIDRRRPFPGSDELSPAIAVLPRPVNGLVRSHDSTSLVSGPRKVLAPDARRRNCVALYGTNSVQPR